MEIFTSLNLFLSSAIGVSVLAALGYTARWAMAYMEKSVGAKDKRESESNKDKRDDFLVITDALYKELQRLEERVKNAEQETEECERRYDRLTAEYSHMESNFKILVISNQNLSTKLQELEDKLNEHQRSDNLKNDGNQ